VHLSDAALRRRRDGGSGSRRSAVGLRSPPLLEPRAMLAPEDRKPQLACGLGLRIESHDLAALACRELGLIPFVPLDLVRLLRSGGHTTDGGVDVGTDERPAREFHGRRESSVTSRPARKAGKATQALPSRAREVLRRGQRGPPTGARQALCGTSIRAVPRRHCLPRAHGREGELPHLERSGRFLPQLRSVLTSAQVGSYLTSNLQSLQV
jgi:hypothetical protein